MDGVFACDNISDGGSCCGGLFGRLWGCLRSRHFDWKSKRLLVDGSTYDDWKARITSYPSMERSRSEAGAVYMLSLKLAAVEVKMCLWEFRLAVGLKDPWRQAPDILDKFLRSSICIDPCNSIARIL